MTQTIYEDVKNRRIKLWDCEKLEGFGYSEFFIPWVLTLRLEYFIFKKRLLK